MYNGVGDDVLVSCESRHSVIFKTFALKYHFVLVDIQG